MEGCSVDQFPVYPITQWGQRLPSQYSGSQLDLTWYSKFTHVNGFPIISSAKTSDAALRVSAKWVCTLFHLAPPAVSEGLKIKLARLSVMAESEKTTQVPEFRYLESWWDTRARGFGASISDSETSLVAEDNVLCRPSDPWMGECILIHEFGGHTMAMESRMDWVSRYTPLYKNAMAKGLFGNTYAATNQDEYWAEGVQDWFDCAWIGPPGGDGVHNDITTRVALKKYDPDLAALIAQFYGDVPIKYSCPTAEELVLAGKDVPINSVATAPNSIVPATASILLSAAVTTISAPTVSSPAANASLSAPTSVAGTVIRVTSGRGIATVSVSATTPPSTTTKSLASIPGPVGIVSMFILAFLFS
ncbi:hypothetical protein BC830DRAFT_1141878 [Chytriomyces sp. MP71]|nr:hypothetical protein BC830DRAFT_1141878 [Chytriomyces sp. MP71]